MKLCVEERFNNGYYNEAHGIVPQTIRKSIEEILQSTSIADVSHKQEARKHVRRWKNVKANA